VREFSLWVLVVAREWRKAGSAEPGPPNTGDRDPLLGRYVPAVGDAIVVACPLAEFCVACHRLDDAPFLSSFR